jgi:hypothetical protein
VTGVAVSPSPASVKRGGERQFTAVVEGLNIPPEEAGVTWTVTGASNSTGTSISGGGLLTAAADETGSLTVRAASVYDITQSATVETAVNALTVRFLADGAVVETAAVGVGGTVPLPALPTKDGAVAKGWYSTSSGDGAKFSGSTLPITADTDIHVRWLASGDTKSSNALGGEVKYVNTSSGFDEVHIFKTNGNFTLPAGVTGAQVLVVAGGGGGGGGVKTDNYIAGGGGGGGVVTHNSYSLGAATYTVVVGNGGAGSTGGLTEADQGSRGGNSSFGPQTGAALFVAIGGGGGGGRASFFYGEASSGGSSGGGTNRTIPSWENDQTVPSGGSKYGNRGGYGTDAHSYAGGGGGGATSYGGHSVSQTCGGTGGAGLSSNITGGDPVSYGGGGNGGGGGRGAVSGAANTGTGGGGGGGTTSEGGAGGSGIVIVRFPYKYNADF